MNMKKVVSIFLALLLFASLSVNTFSAKAVIDKSYDKLLAFGLIEDTDRLYANGTVSRSLFAKYAMTVKGFTKETAASGEYVNPFFDIANDENEWAIIAAANMGMISGTTVGYYEPSKRITLAQAVKVFLCALGYGEIANHNGGYPTGYLQVANQLGLTKGVTATNDGVLSWDAFVRLYYNALNTDIMQGVGVVVNGNISDAVLSATEGVTPLVKYYEIYKAEGILTSNEYTSLYGDSEVSDNMVLIGNAAYNIGETTAYDLIGYYVESYYKENIAGVKTLIYASADDIKNKTYHTKTADIVPNAVNTTSYSYYKNEDAIEKLPISGTASLIYNGALVTMSRDYMCPANGEVTLIDNNNDGIIDVLHVFNYVSFLVYKVSTATNSLLGNRDQVLELDSESKDYDFVITNDGYVSNFEDTVAKQVVSYAAYPKDTKYIKYVKLSSDYVQGKVEFLDNTYANINGVDYKYASDLNVILGVDGTYYKDFMGTIVDYESGKSYVYGFINDMKTNSGLGGKITLYILSENNNWVELNVAKTVKVDGTPMPPTRFYEIHRNDYRQLVRYNVNSAGEIIEIDFAEPVEGKSATVVESMIDNDEFRLSKTLSSGAYSKTPQSFDGIINTLSSRTSIFIVAKDEDKYDLSKFRVVTNGSLQSSSYIDYTGLKAYDSDELDIASALVMYEGTQKVTKSSTIYVVDSVITMLDADGYPVPGIKAYIDSTTPTTLPVKNDDVITAAGGLTKGDVIQLSTTGGVVVNIKKWFPISDVGTKKYYNSSSPTANYFFFGAKVVALDYVTKRVKIDYGSNISVLDFSTLSSVWIYDVDAQIITRGRFDDIQKEDYVFGRAGALVANNLIIYR